VIDDTVDDWDWAAAGNGIGSNRYLWFVYLRLDIREVMPHEDVQAFFGGLALNRSIQALSISLSNSFGEDDTYSYIKEAFEALLP
jgi:hypothetical protein